jgi:2-keto-4-pentenoate hydratase/2-oxohepta-3-ene-1,7-dioic acid hydratase in catechol pathway
MILLSVGTSEGPRLAAKIPAGILIFSQAKAHLPWEEPPPPPTLQAAVTEEGGVERVRAYLKVVLDDPQVGRLATPENEVRVDMPFLPGNVFCVGSNYRGHIQEGGGALPERPILFAKWTSAIIGPGDPIVLPPDTSEVDYEAELAVVMGRRCRGVSAAEALDYVAGYTCMNDVSARDFQRSDGQWARGKGQDTFGPMGPYLVTRDQVPDPQALTIRCLVNGRVRQNSNTQMMIFSVRELIAFISRGITLHAGDVISTGTPDGVGFAQKPPAFLRPGDEVVVEIDGVGRLSNPVKAM